MRISDWSSDVCSSDLQIKAGTVDFGSSDAPLKPDELEKFGLAQFPSVIGGVVPVVHVKGIESGAMKLDGETLANIFLGNVKKWNDTAIAALNGGVQLPSSDEHTSELQSLMRSSDAVF